ncbi:MAG: hypothetical protein PVS3B3_09190 [Ktedonobacteraceae bacterium]
MPSYAKVSGKDIVCHDEYIIAIKVCASDENMRGKHNGRPQEATVVPTTTNLCLFEPSCLLWASCCTLSQLSDLLEKGWERA